MNLRFFHQVRSIFRKPHLWFFVVCAIGLGCGWRHAVASESAAHGPNVNWATYRADQARTGYATCDHIVLSFKPAWFWKNGVRPQPAWPAPARASLWQNLESISARQREDLADVPLVVTDKFEETHILIGSSGGDFLQSFNPADGSTRWSFPLAAPIRFAPVIDEDLVYFGCDDGFVRALSLPAGKLIWETRLGPKLPWIMGNGRLISPHPVRTSLLLSGDQVIAHAGLFPSQGVYSVALDCKTGHVVWRRKIDTSPQGYLLADGAGRGIVPTGRAQPYLIELADGEISATLTSPGGSFCMLTEQRVYTGPGNANQVEVAPHNAEKKLVTFPSQAIASGNGMIWTANGQHLACYRETDLQTQAGDPVWSVPCSLASNLIVIADQKNQSLLFAIGNGKIDIHDAGTGQLKQSLSVPNVGENLIHAAFGGNGQEGFLVATSTSGTVYVWRASAGLSAEVLAESEPADDQKPEVWLQADEAGDYAVDQPAGIETETEGGLNAKLVRLRERLPCSVGLGLMVNVSELDAIENFLRTTDYQIVLIAKDRQQELTWRRYFLEAGIYGSRISVLPADFLVEEQFEAGIFNFVLVVGGFAGELQPAALCAEEGFLLVVGEEDAKQDGLDGLTKIPKRDGGLWRHQYASPSNDADAKDSAFTGAAGFRLQWFGGVGPRRIPDRHLRGAAPLVAGASMVVHGDGCLIGVDPANGRERWQVQLPEGAMRYVIPLDSGYSCLSETGHDLYVAAKDEIWRIQPATGEIVQRIRKPSEQPEQSDDGLQKKYHRRTWGYVAEVHGDLFATLMNSDAPRYSQDRVVLRESFINDDYNSDRPLVCSKSMMRLSPGESSEGAMLWKRESQGVIPNSTISIDDDAQNIVFVEGLSPVVKDGSKARFTTAEILEQGKLVCLNPDTGEHRWEVQLDWPDARNMLYTLIAEDCVVVTSSKSEKERAIYWTKVFGLSDGLLRWEKQHVHVREGLFHGEQVHHPVALRRPDGKTILIVEPYMYDLISGEKVVPPGLPKDWAISRSGHSCGTMTGAGDCLFFRANNPTVFSFNAQGSQDRFLKLSPSRPSCWINMVPAAGRLFIPEGSASCVCQYSLQTSMAFRPVDKEQHQQSFLEDVRP